MIISGGVQSVLLLLGSLYFVSYIDETEARGGRGGGGRGGRSSRSGGSRSSGSRSSYRGGGGVRNGRSHFSSRAAFKTALLAGTIYGSRRYMSRRTYYDNPDYEPTICTNYNLKDENGTAWGRFICPMYNEPDSNDWCCGDDNEEHCCGFWDDGGRMAGTIIGIIIGVVIVVAVIFFCCCKGKCAKQTTLKQHGARNAQYTAQYSSAPPPQATVPETEKSGVPPGDALPYPTSGVAPPYPVGPPPQYGYSTEPPPPAYGIKS